MDAAASVIRTIGLGRSTTKQIASAAGLSEAALYRHFSDKAELFLCVIGERLPQLTAALHDLPGRVGHRSVRANLEDIARVALPFYDQTLPIVTSLFAEPELLKGYQERMRSKNLGPHRALEELAVYLRAEQRLGRVSPRADPEAAAALLLGACLNRALMRHVRGEPEVAAADERFVRSLVRTLIEGLAIPSPD
ncbi:MAG: helix-turn-helix transcriptional regulator [Chloroflexi bacterium]|nr:helix-turn-helix transcriptional regulator [Chloroflexota bacterium]